MSKSERHYEDGSEPRLLDVIDVPVLNAQPSDYQQENWLLDNRRNPKRNWKRVRSMTANKLEEFLDPVSPLWIDGYSSFNGIDDRIPLDEANCLDSSLRLIKVDRLELDVLPTYGKHLQLRGSFTYSGADYCLSITDPIFECRYRNPDYDNCEIGKCYLTVSLGEPFEANPGDGYYSYKLIAAVIPC